MKFYILEIYGKLGCREVKMAVACFLLFHSPPHRIVSLCIFSLVLIWVEKIYQTLQTVFGPYTSKFVKNNQLHIFSTLFSVFNFGQTRSFTFNLYLVTVLVPSFRLSTRSFHSLNIGSFIQFHFNDSTFIVKP